MNLLAHGILAIGYLPHEDDLPLCGALMADYVSGFDIEVFPKSILLGISQHRMIDEFTDAHGESKKIMALLASSGAPRFSSGILLDLFWDHVLARNWEEFGKPLVGIDLPSFSQSVYNKVGPLHGYHSPKFARVLPWIISMDWLSSYGTMEGLAMALEGLSQRLPHGRGLAGCEKLFELHKEAIHGGFSKFWPSIQKQCSNFLVEYLGK